MSNQQEEATYDIYSTFCSQHQLPLDYVQIAPTGFVGLKCSQCRDPSCRRLADQVSSINQLVIKNKSKLAQGMQKQKLYKSIELAQNEKTKRDKSIRDMIKKQQLAVVKKALIMLDAEQHQFEKVLEKMATNFPQLSQIDIEDSQAGYIIISKLLNKDKLRLYLGVLNQSGWVLFKNAFVQMSKHYIEYKNKIEDFNVDSRGSYEKQIEIPNNSILAQFQYIIQASMQDIRRNMKSQKDIDESTESGGQEKRVMEKRVHRSKTLTNKNNANRS